MMINAFLHDIVTIATNKRSGPYVNNVASIIFASDFIFLTNILNYFMIF